MVNYEQQFKNLEMESPIDFLSVDLELPGERLNILKKVFETGYEFKTITIEHDAYCQPVELEKIPQREYLTEKGYTLVRKDEIIEDFWINPKYINEDQYLLLLLNLVLFQSQFDLISLLILSSRYYLFLDKWLYYP